ncbi:hypothetical protein Roomu2_00036 [Pseudomonas phage vB_PpuM-Roomu-2]|uniref:Polynucleotide kinase n=2 Tax=Tartuvirus TaxID=3424912 RepID=A0AAX4N0A3_9CAUD
MEALTDFKPPRNIDPWARTEFLMQEPKVVAVDFDETISDNESGWLQILALLERVGYHVVICTWRTPETYPEDLQFLVDKGYAVFYTSLRSKREYMKEQGIDVAIWIDDNPWAVDNDAPNLHLGCIFDKGPRATKLQRSAE